MKISCIMLVGEFEPYLEYAIKSVKDIVDEIVFITHKTGKFPVTLKPKWKRLVQKGKDVDFAKWRNQALKQCTGDYVLFIDADEVFCHIDGQPISRDHLEKQCKAMDNEGCDSKSFFTYHFLYNYRTIDGRNNGLHFSLDRLFKNEKGIKWVGKIHERLVLPEVRHQTNALRTRNIVGPAIFHFGHCKGMEDIKKKYTRSMDIEDNPFRRELRKGETIDQYVARHELFRDTRPTIKYDGPMPSVMSLW